MRDETASMVHAVLRQGLALKRRLERGETPSLATEQAALEQAIQGQAEPRRYADMGADLEIRYALACWLDEVFILDPTWGPTWNEHKLEAALFGTNDRAWLFWEKARRASSRSDTDVLEVYYLCAMLGFRGDLREEPKKLRAWATVAAAQVEKGGPDGVGDLPDLDPPGGIAPLNGHESLRKMMVRCGVALMILIPAAAFLIVLRVGR